MVKALKAVELPERKGRGGMPGWMMGTCSSESHGEFDVHTVMRTDARVQSLQRDQVCKEMQ